MSKLYIFDVDGTLTEPRQQINEKFKNDFLNFVNNNDVWLITGSDYPKTLEQVGSSVLESVDKVYCCAGAQLYVDGMVMNTKKWEPSKELSEFLSSIINDSHDNGWGIENEIYPVCIEKRPSMVNLCIPGRKCPQHIRDSYSQYDKQKGERKRIVDQINAEFPDITARLGGQISIDIAPNDFNKGMIIEDIKKENRRVVFFGDKMDENGNDRPLADQIHKHNIGMVISVESFYDTWEKIKAA